MAYALEVDIIEHEAGEPVIRMSLTFWGQSEAECEQTWSELQRKYDFFGSARREGRTIEELDEVDDDELPDPEDDEDDMDDDELPDPEDDEDEG